MLDLTVSVCAPLPTPSLVFPVDLWCRQPTSFGTQACRILLNVTSRIWDNVTRRIPTMKCKNEMPRSRWLRIKESVRLLQSEVSRQGETVQGKDRSLMQYQEESGRCRRRITRDCCVCRTKPTHHIFERNLTVANDELIFFIHHHPWACLRSGNYLLGL